jgi:peptide deformylase
MVDLVLDDLGRPAGKGADARLAVGSFVLHLDAFPALGGAHTLQRKTALLGVVGAGLFEDDRVEQHQIPARDLLETLTAHADGCVGMAANMIGVNRCIIAFQDGAGYTVMLNPKILQKSGAYETEEGCLSLTGVRPVKRWKKIKVLH